VADATLAYQPAGAAWSLGAHVNNLGNKIIPVTIDSFGMSVPSAPRTYGVRFDYRY